MSAYFPSAVATQAQLWTQVNGISTTLDGAIDNAITTITVIDTTNFPSSGYIVIDAEIISYTSKTGTTFLGCTRAADNSSAASHTTASTVAAYAVADHHNIVTLELVAVEQNISDRFGLGSTAIAIPNGVTAVTRTRTTAATTADLSIIHSDNTSGSSHSRLTIQTGGASGGDAWILINNSVANYSFGLDNSDSDALCLTAATTLNGTNLLRLTTAGALTIAAGLTITTGGATVTAGGVLVTAGALTVRDTTNQIVLGVTNTTTISSTAPASSRTYTIIDAGGAADFVMTAAAQTINGVKTFGSGLIGPSGSAGSPAFQVASGTGMYSGGADTINWSTASTARMSLDTTTLTLNRDFLCSSATVSAIMAASSTNGSFPRITSSNLNGTSGQNRTALVVASGDNTNITVAMQAGKDSSNANVEIVGGTTKLDMGFGGVPYVRIATSGHVTPQSTTGTQNFGDATNYWNDISYKTLTDRGCLPWCDDGVELVDGRVVSDLEALCQIKRHPTKKTGTGLPRLDYSTFPKHAMRRIEEEFPDQKPRRDENGDAWVTRMHGDSEIHLRAEDGIEMTMMFGVMIGAFKEVDKRLTAIEKKSSKLAKAA